MKPRHFGALYQVVAAVAVLAILLAGMVSQVDWHHDRPTALVTVVRNVGHLVGWYPT